MPVKAFQVPGIPWSPLTGKNKEVNNSKMSKKNKVEVEAALVLKTGKLMGLIPIGSDAEALANIVKRL